MHGSVGALRSKPLTRPGVGVEVWGCCQGRLTEKDSLVRSYKKSRTVPNRASEEGLLGISDNACQGTEFSHCMQYSESLKYEGLVEAESTGHITCILKSPRE